MLETSCNVAHGRISDFWSLITRERFKKNLYLITAIAYLHLPLALCVNFVYELPYSLSGFVATCYGIFVYILYEYCADFTGSRRDYSVQSRPKAVWRFYVKWAVLEQSSRSFQNLSTDTVLSPYGFCAKAVQGWYGDRTSPKAKVSSIRVRCVYVFS